jgi:hypothetical protein
MRFEGFTLRRRCTRLGRHQGDIVVKTRKNIMIYNISRIYYICIGMPASRLFALEARNARSSYQCDHPIPTFVIGGT